MHGTFIRLFLVGRKLGSNPWLPIAILSSSIAAFILSLSLAQYFGLRLDPIGLSEALPFFVIAIGFDKGLQVARAVFSHPQFLLPSQVSLATSLLPIKSAREVVLDAVDQIDSSIVRDYTIEIFVLLVGAWSRVTGLKEFCALAAFILALDCIALFTFYVAILTILVEVHRIKALRATVPSSQSNESTIFQRLSHSLIGVKGAHASPSLIDAASKYVPKEPENPAGRLKLLLIVSFLTLHVLNLCTTLTIDAAIARHHTHATHRRAEESLNTYRKVDIMAPSWTDVLAQLSATQSHVYSEAPPPMVLKVLPQVSLRAVSLDQTSSTSTGFDWLMAGWSAFLDDPFLKKWTAFALALSIFLNGYLLKGLTATAIRTVVVKPDFEDITAVTKAEKTVEKSQPLPPVGLPTPELSRTPSTNSDIPPFPAVVTSRLRHIDLPKNVRPFDECVQTLENGTDGVDLLNDEEIILLAQKGKIAAYALEKVLHDFDRAVRVRRALICASHRYLLGFLLTTFQPAHPIQRPSNTPCSPCRIMTIHESSVPAAKMLSDTYPFLLVLQAHSALTANPSQYQWLQQKAPSSHPHPAAVKR